MPVKQTSGTRVGVGVFRGFFLVGGLSICLLCPNVGHAGVINLTFGSLPSAQGFTYDNTPSGTPESQIFSENGTTLSLDSQGLPVSADGAYFLFGGFKPALDTTLDVTMKVYAGTTASSDIFDLRAGSELFDFGFSDSGVRIQGIATSLSTTDGFHDYRIVLPGGAGTYQLFQDGVLEASGTAITGSFGSGFFRIW